MPNIDKAFGARPVKHMHGDVNGMVNIYAVATNEGTAIFVGDFVSLNGSSINGYASVKQSAASPTASNAIVGAVVGVIPAGIDPVSGKMGRGASPTLDTPQYVPANTGVVRYVLVNDDPQTIFEMQCDDDSSTVAATDVGMNFNIIVGSGNTTTGTSGMEVDSSTVSTTNTLPLQLIGFPVRVDNEIGGTWQTVLVRVNVHRYNTITGITGG